MMNISWISRLLSARTCSATARRIAGGAAAVVLGMTAGMAAAQNPAPETHMSVPQGYALHESVDMGGHIANIYGSGAMYNTLVNQRSGPRVSGESFELRKLDSNKKSGPVDELTAFTSGFGGDPNNVARLTFSKGKLYDFTGLFRRDRQYFDYDLLGNPNIPSGQSIAVSGSTTPYSWSQVSQSPFAFNTVRRMTDTNLTVLPLAKVSLRLGYSQNIFQGPSQTPGGYFGVLSNDILLQEYQRNSTDSFLVAIDWKPVQGTKLTYEEQMDHYKGDSYFTLAPQYFSVQEADGTKAALLANYDSLTPYASSSCNTGYTSILYAPQTSGGRPVVDPYCAVITSYQRYQPTREIFPTEQFRLQSSSIRNVTMNGNVRFTKANMNMPNYYENFQGLTKATTPVRSSTYTGYASAKREVIAVDYGIAWKIAPSFSVAEQINYSNTHQPGSANLTGESTLSNPATNLAITYTGPLTAGTSTAAPEGMPGVGNPFSGYFGQKFVTNNLTATWDVSPRTTLSLGWRYGSHAAHYNAATYTATGTVEEPQYDVTVHENGGILNAAFRPASNWTINGTLEMIYHDNVITPVAPRETQHYKIRTAFKPKPWASVSASYNDLERHNNTNNTGAASIYGPLQHADHSRYAGIGAELTPNEHYGFEFNYAYSDVYTTTNICYTGIQTAGFPAAAPANGAACYNASAGTGNTTIRGAAAYEFGPVQDFQDAPTQFGTMALSFSPVDKFHSHLGYTVSSVNGSRFFSDARDVNGSLVSTYQTPFVDVSYAVRKDLVWKAEYNYFGYGEGGVSGAQYCASTNPTAPTGSTAGAAPTPVTVVPCNTLANTAASGATFTAPRNFHANNVSLGFHYEF